MANGVSVAPQILRWARERSGRSAEQLEQRFPKLSEWEAGEGQPTLRQLEDYAQATYTPVGSSFSSSRLKNSCRSLTSGRSATTPCVR
jgi:transcriptional regulator with XRE-family HTH domain